MTTFTVSHNWGVTTLEGHVTFTPQGKGSGINPVDAQILNGVLSQLNGTAGVPLTSFSGDYLVVFLDLNENGYPGTIPSFTFAASTGSTGIDLGNVFQPIDPVVNIPFVPTPPGGAPIVAADITNATATGIGLITAASSAGALSFLGATSLGQSLLTAASQAAALAALGTIDGGSP